MFRFIAVTMCGALALTACSSTPETGSSAATGSNGSPSNELETVRMITHESFVLSPFIR